MCIIKPGKADIFRFRCLLMNAVRIPLTHRLVLYTLDAGDCLFCVQTVSVGILTAFSQNIPIYCVFLLFSEPFWV